ncbi:unnamed protein product [Victoria cruziana]
MPASAAPSPSYGGSQPEELIARLSSGDRNSRLKALREVKNQIIGNRTKKLSYIKIGAVPRVAEILASDSSDAPLLVQSAATIGSFTCGVDAGVTAVLDSGAVPLLIRTLSNPDQKVVDAGARSLRMIFQSKLAPKYDLFQDENMGFLLSLLNSENENVTELAGSIITWSCETNFEQKMLCNAGVLQRLVKLLSGSTSQRDASLDSLAAIMKNNYETVSRFISLEDGRALNAVVDFIKDRTPRTRLLACVCLIAIVRACPCYMQDLQLKIKMVLILTQLIEEPGRPGDEAPFALKELVNSSMELQNASVSVTAVEKICDFLPRASLQNRRFEGILLVLAEICSKIEERRSQLLDSKVFYLVTEALKHDCAAVRTAACNCIRSVSRSVKHLSAGRFTNEVTITNLTQLLNDTSTAVQVAALGTISNILVDFKSQKSIFFECGGVKQLVHLSKSMDPVLRLNAVLALRNVVFLADGICKQKLVLELTVSTLTSLICDPEPFVQEQAMALVRNLVDGCIESIDLVFTEDGVIMNAMGRQLRNSSRSEVCTQGMYVFSNVATGSEFHKEEVMRHLLPSAAEGCNPSVLIRFLQDSNDELRVATIWCIVNLTHPWCHGVTNRIEKLRSAGVICQVKRMENDPCLDVKFRVRMAIEQWMTIPT